MTHRVMCSKIFDGKAVAWVELDYDKETCTLELPFSSDCCLQCSHERIELEVDYNSSEETKNVN